MDRFSVFALSIFIATVFFTQTVFSQNSSGQEKLNLTIKPPALSFPSSSSSGGRSSLPMTSEGPTEIIRLFRLPATPFLPVLQPSSPIPIEKEDVDTVQKDHFEITLFPMEEYISADDTLVIQGIIKQPIPSTPETHPSETSSSSPRESTESKEPVEIQYALEDEEGNMVILEKEIIPPDSDFFFRKQLRIQPEMENGKFRLVVGVAQATTPQATTVSRITFSPEKIFLDFTPGIIMGFFGGVIVWGYLKWSLRV